MSGAAGSTAWTRTLQRTKRQPSLLTLKPAPSGVPLNLTLLLWPEGAGSSSPHQPPTGEPEKRIVQCFTRLDPDMGVFGTGSFSRGTLHRSTWTKLYAEFGFLHEQRRHRLVLLWDGAGQLDRICLLYTSPSPRDKRQSRMPSSA